MSARTARLLASLTALHCAACAPAPPLPAAPPAPCPPPAVAAAATSAPAAAPALPDAKERAALFAELVGAVRKYHVFSAITQQNLGRRWEDDLPALERAFAEASTEPLLRDALTQFGNSMHDGHVRYDPETRSERFTNGLTVDVEWIEGAPRFYVAGVDAKLQSAARPGDVIVSANGVPAEKLVDVHMLRSNGNSRRRVAAGVAQYLSARHSMESATRPGDRERWVLGHREGGEVTVELVWQKAPWPGAVKGDQAYVPFEEVDYDRQRCSRDLRDIDYGGGYRLSAHGKFFCLYTSDKAPADGHPIVRHYSFRYSGALPRKDVYPGYYLPETPQEVEAEYFTLSRLLRERARTTKGVILDLRDNQGGNDPEWFLDWYAPGPYVDGYYHVPRLAEWEDPGFRARAINGDDEDFWAWYQRAAKGTDAPFLRRPSKCRNEACDGDNRFVPAHNLVDKPIALLVGPGCGSACAMVAQIFDENDFGPLLGEPTSASFTTLRLEHPIRTRAGRELGKMRMALSKDDSGKTGELLEGRAVHVDYPVERTCEGRARWDAALAETALRAFKEYRFPKRTARMGP